MSCCFSIPAGRGKVPVASRWTRLRLDARRVGREAGQVLPEGAQQLWRQERAGAPATQLQRHPPRGSDQRHRLLDSDHVLEGLVDEDVAVDPWLAWRKRGGRGGGQRESRFQTDRPTRPPTPAH